MMEKRATKNYWIGGLIMLGLFFVSLIGWSFFAAGRGVSSVVDPDYYAHGLRYNDSRRAQQAAAAIGWQAAAVIKDGKLTVHLTDADNDPVTDCRGHILLHMANRENHLPVRFALDESSPGVYAVPLPSGMKGAVLAEYTLEKEDKLLKRKILLSLQAAASKQE